MSNLVCIGLSILVAFVSSALFMSVYKEDISDELHTLRTRVNDSWTEINMLKDQIYAYNAKIYDLKNKLEEMEKLDDGK